ncbi:hypothetical protein ACIO1C_01400 [Streptomyces sp. NPDC087420]|uniref:hypothetical protein n=1 Tax=Streptomyces sp. NPDC087420 TaxID=3365785 RepID=UPI0038389319
MGTGDRSGRGMRLSSGPAGDDHELRAVLQDVASGYWMSMQDLLLRTEAGVLRTEAGADWAQWTFRTQVLGAASAGTTVVQTWQREVPDSRPASVMRARVAVERALRANRIGDVQHLQSLWWTASAACAAAAEAAPHDPVPFLCRLALAELDPGQVDPEHRRHAPDPQLFPGPWGLLAEVDRRDPGNREAYHRMARYFLVRKGGSVAHQDFFARWVADGAPAGSALLALPLYVAVERWRATHTGRESLDASLYWVTDRALERARVAYREWFAVTPSRRLTQDMNYLAHALWSSQQYGPAAEVFRALGPHASPRPWLYLVADGARWERLFLDAHEASLANGSP